MDVVVQMLLAWFVAAGGTSGDRDLCDLMSGASAAAMPGPFAGVAGKGKGGDAAAAAREFLRVASELSSLAEELFFAGDEGDEAEAAAFMEAHVRGEGGALAVRGDRFALRLWVVAWGAWLCCRAGERESGVTLLKSGWRDWAEPRLRTDAVFLLLAAGDVEGAVRFVRESPGTPEEHLAAGLVLCRSGKKEEGLDALDRGLEGLADPGKRQVVERRRCECR